MFNKNNKLESLSSRKRYLYGKQVEDNIVKALESYGLKFEEVDRKTDCEDKIDRILIENNTKKNCQIKCRMGYSGSDILVDIWEPFMGVDNPATKPGRDYIGKYETYIVLIKDIIYVINGNRQKKIIEDVLEEWKSAHHQLPVFESFRYAGVQLRYSVDKSNGRSKILMFIPVKTYEGNEVQKYEMKY